MAENTEVENQVNTSPAKKKGMSFALSAIIVGIGLIITKGSGLIRDVIVSLRFSDGVFRDAYTLAFNIPDLFYNLLVGGAIYSTVAPYLSAQLAVLFRKLQHLVPCLLDSPCFMRTDMSRFCRNHTLIVLQQR